MRTDYEDTQNLKKYSVKDCPYHANKDKILKRINELKSIHQFFSMKSETDDGLSSCSNFPERPSSYELESDKPVLPEIEHLKGKIGEGDFKKLRDLLNRNADVFSKHKADIGCCNFVEHEIELEEGAVPHREGARRMTPHKSEACRAEIEMLLEYDMIELSKSPWACGVVMAKKKGASLTVSKKVKIMPSRRQHEENERDCRTIVQQLVSSIPQEILTSTSYGQKEQGSSKRKKTVTFVDQDKEGKKVEQNRLQDHLSGETNDEKNQRSQDQHPGQENLSGESEIDEKIPDEKQDLENKVLSGEFRWMRRRHRHDLEERAVSSTTSSTDDDSRNSGMDTYSDRNSSSGSELSELAIHTLLVETRARDLDREVYQDPDSDRYLIPSERVFDNAADDLETIAVSKRSISLLPQKEVVRTDLQPFEQETQPLAKIWCVKMGEDTHQPNELNSQMRVMKTYLKARYRLSDLLRAQRNDRMTSNLKRWIENGSPDKGDLEEDSYRILRQYFMQKEGRLYLNKDGIVACKRREEDRVLYKYNAIVLPQLYQTELLFRSHDQMGHQGIDKVYQRILKRFEWPGMKKACEKWVTACLSCQQVKDPRKLRFPLQSIESSEFNEVVQIDHQKICMTDNGYNQVLVMIDHFTKYAEAVPCITASAEETCDHLINTWIARHGCPMTFQSDNGTAFVGELTKELMRRSQVAQAHSTT